MFDVIGGEILQRSTTLVRAGGTLVTIAEPPTIQPENGRAIFFVVEADRRQLAELAERLRDGRLASNVGAVRPLAEAPPAFDPDAPRVSGKTRSKSPRAGRGPRSTALGHRCRELRVVDNAGARRARAGDPLVASCASLDSVRTRLATETPEAGRGRAGANPANDPALSASGSRLRRLTAPRDRAAGPPLRSRTRPSSRAPRVAQRLNPRS